MNRSRSLFTGIGVLWLGAMSAGGTGCGGEGGNSFYFVGRVYDGVSGERLTSYTMNLQYFDQTKKGKVDPGGRYVVGPLPEGNDFSILIAAKGYRAFQSHNPMLMVEDFEEIAKAEKIQGERRTLYYDAYLFPADLQASAVTFNVVLQDDPQQKPSGQLRLRPADRSMFYDSAAETPVGVGTQLWTNDEDLQADAVDAEVSNGTASLEAGRLVYGVTYNVNVFGIADYEDTASTFQAGMSQDKIITLAKNATPAAQLLYRSTQEGVLSYTAGVDLVFDQPLELDPLYSNYAEGIDDNVSINSPDTDGDTARNTLRADGSGTIQERGTSIQISGNVVQLGWDPGIGLASTDSGDPIYSVTYGGLNLIRLRPVGGKQSDSFLLSARVGANAITVTLAQTNVAN